MVPEYQGNPGNPRNPGNQAIISTTPSPSVNALHLNDKIITAKPIDLIN